MRTKQNVTALRLPGATHELIQVGVSLARGQQVGVLPAFPWGAPRLPRARAPGPDTHSLSSAREAPSQDRPSLASPCGRQCTVSQPAGTSLAREPLVSLSPHSDTSQSCLRTGWPLISSLPSAVMAKKPCMLVTCLSFSVSFLLFSLRSNPK